jgi:RNA polymerase sigma-70 factor, ECF subfamily
MGRDDGDASLCRTLDLSSPAHVTQRSNISRTELERWFDMLMRTHGPALTRLAGSYTRTASEREDLVQEIALAIWTALPRFRGDSSERTFLFRIAHNRAMSSLSRRRPPTVDVDADLEIHDSMPDPERALARDRRTERLAWAVRQLPVGYAQVVTLTLEGLGYAEIADVLGISETNVGARLTRAREMLRRLLRTDGA